MAKYDVFLSYTIKDGKAIAKMLASELSSLGHSVFLDFKKPMSYDDYTAQVLEAIALSDCFIPIVTESYYSSKWAMAELNYALESAETRLKKIIPVITNKDLLSKNFSDMPLNIAKYNGMMLRDDSDIPSIAQKISSLISQKSEYDRLYEMLSEYSKLKSDRKAAETVCGIVDIVIVRYRAETDFSKRREYCKELFRLYKRLEDYCGMYDDESRNTANRIIKTLDRTIGLLDKDIETEQTNEFLNDLFLSAFAVKIWFLDREIRKDCADTLTSGNAVFACPIADFAAKQKPFVDAFRQLYSADALKEYNDKDRAFIEETPKYILDPTSSASEKQKPVRSKESGQPKLSEEDKILLSIAHFMQEGNKLFDVLQKNKLEGSFMKCLLTSYERLKAYCEVIGASQVASECVERIVEIRDLVEKHEDSKAEDGKAEKGIKSLLGFTLHGSGNYDVFISFKNEDSDLAEMIYKYCQKHNKEVFWSKRSLPELSKSAYEDAIYEALRKSKHFVVVLSNIEYLKANWVKKEMQVFDRAITEGRKKDANFVFVVTDDVYDQIISSNKMCLDERYCGYQIIKLSEYESVLDKYI